MSENAKVKQIMALLDKLTPEEKELFDEFWEWDKWDKWEKKNESIPSMVQLPFSVQLATGLYESGNPFSPKIEDITKPETMESLLPYVQPTEPIVPNSDRSLYSFTGVFKRKAK